MEPTLLVPANVAPPRHPLPLSFVPMPSAAYRLHRKAAQLAEQPGRPRLTLLQADTAPPPALHLDLPVGSRVLIWKQDPSVADLGVRKSYLPGIVLQGPRDARITYGVPGIAAVSPNSFGDFIMAPETDQFDAVHTFAIVRQTLTMYQRALAASGAPAPLPWQWNSASNTAPLAVLPHGLPDVMNAYYSRSDRAVKFGDFIADDEHARMYTCRSLDIVSHETGHAVLDGLKPRWLLSNNPPQTGGLHESFGDLTAIFLTLSQLDLVEAVIAQTRADLHDKTFLADMAEQFGLALGRPNGLRNADNDLKLSDAGTEVHAISQVFTGAIYDILADMFSFERQPAVEDDAVVLLRVGEYLRGLVLRALLAAPDSRATFADVANQMMSISATDGKPQDYIGFIRNRFIVREVLSTQALAGDGGGVTLLQALVVDAPNAPQDRRACCGTMNHAQYGSQEDVLDDERQALAAWCHGYHNGAAGNGAAAGTPATP